MKHQNHVLFTKDKLMGCGIKAWREEEDDRIHEAKVDKFKQKDIVESMFKLEEVQDSLRRFIESDPHLSRVQWRWVDDIEKQIGKLLK